MLLAAGVAFAQDVICPQEGSFSCEGTPEGDLITGSPFKDYEINARGGADVVHALAGDDRLYGGPRRDTLYGEGDTDDLFGGTGADTLNEGTNSTHPFGSGLCGGRGNDKLNGGPGPDRYQFGYLWGKDTIVGELDDASGDIIDFNMYGGQLLCGELGGTVDSSLTIDMPAGQIYETSEGPSGANIVSFIGSRIEIVHGGGVAMTRSSETACPTSYRVSAATTP
jgi:hypothetical protein